mmetsp:Transcript_22203/g.38931  ORF Transcript_22203/g.38931 Transcript_22203/m.38931 type:complete len:104 (-) Transcript_22203:158-469(-)
MRVLLTTPPMGAGQYMPNTDFTPYGAPAAQAAATSVVVTVPPGMNTGDVIQVQTPAGLMKANVPAELGPGRTFTMAVPAPAAQAPVVVQATVVEATVVGTSEA